MDTIVGARKVNGCKCVLCTQCLVDKEVLYLWESRITLSQAIKDDIHCSSCKVKLYTEQQEKAASALESSKNLIIV